MYKATENRPEGTALNAKSFMCKSGGSWFALAMVLILAACGKQQRSTTSAHDANGKLQIVATIFPLADWARAVGGDRVVVSTLLPAGRSPHTFDPSPADGRSVAKAALFLKAGLKMDDWSDRLQASAKGKLRVVSLGDLLAASHQLPDVEHVTSGPALGEHEAHESGEHEGHEHEHDHEGVNPHFWLDPQLAQICVAQIRDELSTADPSSSATYASNAEKYIGELKQLDADAAAELKECGENGFVSFHNAYPYLARRYGLKIAAVIEEFPGKTPSEQYIKAVATEVRQRKISTIFSEPQLNPHVAEVLATETGARADVLDPYGSDTAEDRNSYVKLIRYNVAKLKKAVCGEAK
jgi:zinc transport system substrate-binding protein